MAQLPSAGGDITNIADTAPGVVVNGTGGYGNFTVNGMPATSNLFTVNGENDMDPYFNINNSGASNLTLGQNEIGEATVITNPYGGQYGQLRGRAGHVRDQVRNQPVSRQCACTGGMDATECQRLDDKEVRLQFGTPNGPFSNANQWATSFGGPIIKNKTFFFVDYEGMRFLLPNVDRVTAPSHGVHLLRRETSVAAFTPPSRRRLQQVDELLCERSGVHRLPVTERAQYQAIRAPALVLPGFTSGATPCSRIPTRYTKGAGLGVHSCRSV